MKKENINSLNAIYDSYYKIIEVNIKTGKYNIIKTISSELSDYNNFFDWWKDFGRSNVAEDDKNTFFSFFKNIKSNNMIFYRRKVENEYELAFIEAIHLTADDYLICVKNVDTPFMNNLTQQEYMANHDELTGIYNRHAYEEFISNVNDSKYFIAYIDLDNLKVINDIYGHTYGDIYITRCVNLLVNWFRKDDIYRIGGDEFVIITRSSKNRFYDGIDNILKQAHQENLDMSIGYVCGEGDIKEDIKKAEQLMYKEKRLKKQLNN